MASRAHFLSLPFKGIVNKYIAATANRDCTLAERTSVGDVIGGKELDWATADCSRGWVQEMGWSMGEEYSKIEIDTDIATTACDNKDLRTKQCNMVLT